MGRCPSSQTSTGQCRDLPPFIPKNAPKAAKRSVWAFPALFSHLSLLSAPVEHLPPRAMLGTGMSVLAEGDPSNLRPGAVLCQRGRERMQGPLQKAAAAFPAGRCKSSLCQGAGEALLNHSSFAHIALLS